jgi:transaldolase/transaldolase/glucose-6-phosphate isomerase
MMKKIPEESPMPKLIALEKLKALGIDLDRITQKLQDDGVVAFAKPFDALMQSLAEKKDRLAKQGA